MKVRVTFYKFPSEITKEEKKNIFENFDIDKDFNNLPLDRNRLYLAKILNCNEKDFMEDIFKHIHKYTSLGGTK